MLPASRLLRRPKEASNAPVLQFRYNKQCPSPDGGEGVTRSGFLDGKKTFGSGPKPFVAKRPISWKEVKKDALTHTHILTWLSIRFIDGRSNRFCWLAFSSRGFDFVRVSVCVCVLFFCSISLEPKSPVPAQQPSSSSTGISCLLDIHFYTWVRVSFQRTV